MKKLFKPAFLLFYFLSFFSFLFFGAWLASVSGAADGQGLAGGAIVLFYGVIAAVVALVLSVVFAHRIGVRIIKILNVVLLILLLSTAAWVRYRYKTRAQPNDQEETKQEVKEPTPVAPIFYKESVNLMESDTELGMGFFFPDFFQKRKLVFYETPNFEKALGDHSHVDSLVFEQLETGLDIKHAPPWLLPEYMKLDYEIMYFKILAIGQEFIMIEANKSDGRVAYIDRSQGRVMEWTDFLLGVYSIEWLEGSNKNVHLKPFERSSLLTQDYITMHPYMRRGEWLLVDCRGPNNQSSQKGWIRWIEDGKIKISYSFLC